MQTEEIQISEYNYDLPEERIAKYPLKERSSSKLLLYNKGNISEDKFINIKNYLPANSLLVFNNTKVIQARLEFYKTTGARIEIFCLSPIRPVDYQISLSSTQKVSWKCMIGNAKKWKSGDLHKELEINSNTVRLTARISANTATERIVEFEWNSGHTFAEILSASGFLPIPPYLNRDTEDIDHERYQTVYACNKGSVAAPTAGLHFTDSVINDLKSNNISVTETTLHVGAGTFQPVKKEKVKEHAMHSETIIIEKKLLRQLLEFKGKIIATGTTSLRTLESIYWLGVKCFHRKNTDILEQWEWEKLESIDFNKSLNALITKMDNQGEEQLTASTEIMIVPGYHFKTVNALITNFHQPKSTLLLLIAALIGSNWKQVYEYALANNFRFLSYGDSSFLNLNLQTTYTIS